MSCAIDVELGHAERAGHDAVAAGDAARLARALDDAVAGALDRVGGADLGARRLLAVHAHHRHGLHASARDRRTRGGSSSRPGACRTRCTPARRPGSRCSGSDRRRTRGRCGTGITAAASRFESPRTSGGASARRTRQPHTLYCGILLIGSCAATVSRFGALVAGPVVGNEHGVGADRRDDLARR